MKDEKIYLHSDDYAYTLETSKDILDCLKNGALDSISIIPNTSYFNDSIKEFYKEIPNFPFLPLINVHLNIIEGYSSNEESEILSDNGVLNKTWGKILFLSLSLKRKKLKKELKIEIKNQINKIDAVVKKCMDIAKKSGIPTKQKAIRIDSHTHTHPIPIVWEALVEVIEENGFNVEYIRNSKEPIMPFITNFELMKTYRPINFIKNIILNIFSFKIDRYVKTKNVPTMYLWGLIMSGHMDFERIKILYDHVYAKAKDNNRNLELLFHVGKAEESELSEELNPINMKKFNASKNRNVDKNAALCISRKTDY